ncbi:RluA family pseudouridine synthase [Myxococcota bacterium]|nr:RluA family pseudouridine synthase [Myxococcota bacterium]
MTGDDEALASPDDALDPEVALDEDDEDLAAPPTPEPIAEPPTTFTVEAALDGVRLDQVLKHHVPDRSRALLQRHVEAGAVTLDGAPPKRGNRTPVAAGTIVVYTPPIPEPVTLVAEDLPLSILFEDEDVLVVDKPKNLVVHPALGHPRGTLVNAVLFHVRALAASPRAATMRPGIVHRLDRDTTGAIVIAKNEAAHEALGRAFAERRVAKEYVAVTIGAPKDASGTLDTFYGRHPRDRKRFSSKVASGKRAITHYTVRERYPGAALVDVRLETGRTHQIRVHLADLGHPLVGDRSYGRRGSVRHPKSGLIIADLDRPALHARRLAFPHPRTGRTIDVVAPLPADLEALLATLRAAR